MQPPKLVIDHTNKIHAITAYREVKSKYFKISVAVTTINKTPVVLRDTEQVTVLPEDKQELSCWRHVLQTLLDLQIWLI